MVTIGNCDSDHADTMTGSDDRQGHDRPVCGARKHQGEGTCKRPAGWGTDHAGIGVCKLHGGCTPTVSRGAHRLALEAGVRDLLGGVDVQPVEDPLAALGMLAGEVVAFKNLIAVRLADLTSDTGGADLGKLDVVMFERALDRCSRLLVDMGRLNIDERMVRLSEAQHTMMGQLIDRVLADLGVADDPRVQGLLERHLRELTAA